MIYTFAAGLVIGISLSPVLWAALLTRRWEVREARQAALAAWERQRAVDTAERGRIEAWRRRRPKSRT